MRKTNRLSSVQHKSKPISASLRRRLLSSISKFKHVPVLVVGDLMLDTTVRGDVSRISPEAPVPVIHVNGGSSAPGGCGNVIANLAALGARPSIVSICGHDANGTLLRRNLSQKSVNISGLIVDSQRPTITKTRILAARQQIARLDIENSDPISSKISRELMRNIEILSRNQKAIIISDYGKGVVTRPIIKKSISLSRKNKIPLIVDPKVEHFMYYNGVDCITPNTKETIEGMRALPPKTEFEFVQLGWKVIKKLQSRSLLVTRGEKGMLLYQKGKPPRGIPTQARDVFDVTGAGDTVVATLTLARAVGLPYYEAALLANAAAGLVVEKVGTAVVSVTELARRIKALS